MDEVNARTETDPGRPPPPWFDHPESVDSRERAMATASPRLRRWALIGILLTGVTMTATFAGNQARAPLYAAATDLLFSASDSLPAQQMEREVATQAVVLSSRSIIGPVAADHGVPFDELSERLTVENLRDTNVIRLRVEADDPQTAQELAGEVVDRYLEHTTSTDTSATGTAEVLEQQMADLDEELDEVNQRVSDLDAERHTSDGVQVRSAEQVRLETRATVLSQRIGSLQDRLLAEELELQSRTKPVIIAEASAFSEPVTPTLVQSLAAAGLAGLLVAGAFLMAVLAVRRGDGARSERQTTP